MSLLIKGMEMPKYRPERVILHPNGQAIKSNAIEYEEYEFVFVPEDFMKSPLKITLEKPDHGHKITFFETPAGDFDRVDHHGDAVTWQHHITLGEVGYTIYACSELGYAIERKEIKHK